MIRKATPADVEALVNLSIEDLEIDAYEGLLVSKRKVRNCVVECVSSPSNFSYVSENNGEIDGGLGAVVFPMMFYERSSAQIVMWYSKGGDGIKLLTEFMSWVKGRKIIKEVQYTGERNGNERILNFLEKRHGFKRDVPFLYRV